MNAADRAYRAFAAQGIRFGDRVRVRHYGTGTLISIRGLAAGVKLDIDGSIRPIRFEHIEKVARGED